MSKYSFPPIGNWQDFETFCRDFFELHWSAQSVNVVGRSGQPQNGLDLLVMLPDMTFRGVQCKQKTKGQLSKAAMKKELDATAKLKVRLERYVFATTVPRDANAQQTARALAKSADFPVEIFAWDDFCDALADAKYRDLIKRTWPHYHLAVEAPIPTDASPDQALDAFRRRHWSGLLPLPSLAQASGQRSTDLLLTDIYTAINVKARLFNTSEEGAFSQAMLNGRPTSSVKTRTSLPGNEKYLDLLVGSIRSKAKSFARRCRAVEAAAANRHLVIVGAPGSGKSTFGRFLAACLLGESLEQPESNLSTLIGSIESEFVPWPHGAPLSFFVSLQKFQTSDAFPGKGEKGESEDLVRYLLSLGPDESRGAFGRGLEDALTRPDGALVILDGLDETLSAEASRVQLKEVVSGFVRAYPGCRVLVTSRPYAYEKASAWRLDDAGFANVELAPFDDGQQRVFVEAWYHRLVARNLLDVTPERQAEMASDLVSRIRSTNYLAPLAKSPLMLTMMADLHASNSGRLPAGGRAALYAESVDLLLDRWNETRDGTKPTEALGMTLEQIQVALQKLAFEVHRSRGVSDEETPEIRRSELWEVLQETREAYGHEDSVNDKKIMDYLHQRSGILIGESESIYRFPHRSYQEYLAASYLVDNEFPERLDEVVTEDPALWREVVPLAVGQLKPFMAWTIVETLVPSQPPIESLDYDDPRFFRALLAGLSIRECGLHQRLAEAHTAKLERVRAWVRRAVEIGALDVQDRVLAGQLLGLFGDDRPGVGLVDGQPNFEWVEIPAGPFTMGSDRYSDEGPAHEEFITPFRISRYPLTNAQYRPFVEAGGYTEAWRHCWTAAGWEWRVSEEILGPLIPSSPFELPNHPQVNVSWYEAVAYCRWLSEVTGIEQRLPTEAEWERAARGLDGRQYPWGDELAPELCNTRDTGIRSTTAVGLFPGGEGPAGSNGIGVRDASGNVSEWCATKWRDRYEESVSNDLEGSDARVLRNCSYFDRDDHAGCAVRRIRDPGDDSKQFGFRLAATI